MEIERYPKAQPYFRIFINRFWDIHKSNYGYPILILYKDILKSNNYGMPFYYIFPIYRYP